MGPGPILRPAAAAFAFPTRAAPSHPPAGDHRVVAPRICRTSTDTRRWPGDDRHPGSTPRFRHWLRHRFIAPSPVGSSATQTTPQELSECIGRWWGLVSGADDEHEPCLPSGGRESNGRCGRCVGVGRICGTAAP